MSQIDHIKSEIEALSAEEFAHLRAWIANKDWQDWDVQLGQDATSGKLDFLRDEALAAKANNDLHDL